jgi:DNA-binding LacI/PurR family transcriptional regulator
VVHDIKREKLAKGEVYINLMDDDLVTLIEKIILSKLKIGKEIGVISYNETPLKKIILNGITTISTDFEAMGIVAANIVKTGIKTTCEVPFRLTARASL